MSMPIQYMLFNTETAPEKMKTNYRKGELGVN